jgi:hypothetical protein
MGASVEVSDAGVQRVLGGAGVVDDGHAGPGAAVEVERVEDSEPPVFDPYIVGPLREKRLRRPLGSLLGGVGVEHSRHDDTVGVAVLVVVVCGDVEFGFDFPKDGVTHMCVFLC